MSRKIAVWAWALLLACTASAEDCASLEECLAKFPSVATTGPGIGTSEVELAEAVQRFGARAIPFLIEMLEHGPENVRILAGFTLGEVEGLASEHLPALVRARKRGDGWIPAAIAKVGTPEAIAFLIEDLRDDPQIHTQVTGALEHLGARAAPGVADLLRCAEDCNTQVLSAAAFVISEMKESAAGAIPQLLQIASDRGMAEPARRTAILALGHVGPSAREVVPRLTELGRQEPLLRNTLDAALVLMGSAEAIPGLLRRLPIDPKHVLQDIGMLGGNGYAAGPSIETYLGDHRWDVRVEAAKTLGEIGYAPAEPALRKTLTNDDDWKLAYASALALASLDAEASLASLDDVQKTHWYPPVRKIALAVKRHIESGEELAEPDWWTFSSAPDSPTSCGSTTERTVRESPRRKLHGKGHARQLKRLAYDSAVRSYGPPDDAEADEYSVIEMNESDMVEHVTTIRQVPLLERRDPAEDRAEQLRALHRPPLEAPARGPREIVDAEGWRHPGGHPRGWQRHHRCQGNDAHGGMQDSRHAAGTRPTFFSNSSGSDDWRVTP
jgi:HEAT repeat protein